MTALYDEGVAAAWKGNLDLDTATIDMVAVNPSYVFDAADVAADLTAFIVDTDASLGGNSVAATGWFTTSPATFTGLDAPEEVGGFVLRVQGGVLLSFHDRSTGGVVVDIEADGSDLTVNPSSDGWFR